MPTDVQFKYELENITELERKLELLQDEEYEKLEKRVFEGRIQDIQTSLED